MAWKVHGELAVGPPGCGKTSLLAERAAAIARESPRRPTVLIHDPFGQDAFAAVGAVPILTPEHHRRLLRERGRAPRAVRFIHAGVASVAHYALELAPRNDPQGNPVLLVLDEVDRGWRKSEEFPTELDEICNYHRHLGISWLASVRYLFRLPPAFRACARDVHFFYLTSPRECAEIAHAWGPEAVERIRRLERHEYETLSGW